MSLTGLLTALSEDRSFANIRTQAARPIAERSAETIISATDGLRAPVLAQISEGLAAAGAAASPAGAGGPAPVLLAYRPLMGWALARLVRVGPVR